VPLTCKTATNPMQNEWESTCTSTCTSSEDRKVNSFPGYLLTN